MPFIRVSYQKLHYDTGQLTSVSHTIMDALIQHFNVPEDDLFQVFHAHHPDQFFYSNNYLGIERSNGLLIIQITLKSGRTTNQKTRFYEALARQLAISVPMRQEDVFIVLTENEYEDWSFGNGIAQMLQR